MHPRRDRAAELCDGSGHAFQSKQSRVNMLCLCARLERKPPHSLQAWTLWAGATRQFHRQSDGRVSRFECNSIPEPLCRSLGQGDGGREGGREREREIWAQAILAQAIWAQVWLKLELPGLGEGHWVFFARYSGPEVHGQPFLLNFVLGGHTIARYRDLIPGGPCVCGG